MNHSLLIQMAGHGGSGKSTLARQLAGYFGGVVIDLDVIKTALLDTGIEWSPASTGSYEVIHALVDDFLATGSACVVVDTPSYWADIHERLTSVASRHGASYVFVECNAAEEIRARRLVSRPTKRSQIPQLGRAAADAPSDTPPVHQRPIVRPPGGPCVVVDTNHVVDLDGLISHIAVIVEASNSGPHS
jgi:predicted kinase